MREFGQLLNLRRNLRAVVSPRPVESALRRPFLTYDLVLNGEPGQVGPATMTRFLPDPIQV